MRIDRIFLENFRNYRKLEVDLGSDLVLIVGENASGKTNFLESIYFLSNLKSFRAPDNLLVNHGEDHFAIRAALGEEQLEVVVQNNPAVRRGFKVNGQKIKKIAWNAFKTVLFAPNDLNMFILGPDARRRFLNDVLVEKESLYPIDLASLDHILKQRGALLENIRERQADPLELEFWDRELAQVGVRISRARRNFIDYLNDNFPGVYESLTGFKNSFLIVYKGLGEGISESGFMEMLSSHRAAEIRSGMNLIGPHRDDLMIMKDGLQNVYNSSRGELREQILAIKILHAKYITVGGVKPIMLMDDVFSELDRTRREKLLSLLTDTQVILTSTEEMNVSGLTLKVKEGSILSNNQA